MYNIRFHGRGGQGKDRHQRADANHRVGMQHGHECLLHAGVSRTTTGPSWPGPLQRFYPTPQDGQARASAEVPGSCSMGAAFNRRPDLLGPRTWVLPLHPQASLEGATPSTFPWHGGSAMSSARCGVRRQSTPLWLPGAIPRQAEPCRLPAKAVSRPPHSIGPDPPKTGAGGAHPQASLEGATLAPTPFGGPANARGPGAHIGEDEWKWPPWPGQPVGSALSGNLA